MEFVAQAEAALELPADQPATEPVRRMFDEGVLMLGAQYRLVLQWRAGAIAR
jgi:hypothetical protein